MTSLTLVDLLLRFSGVGIMLTLSTLLWHKLGRGERLLALTLSLSLTGFLLLTQPIHELRFNPARGVFLFLTELFPFVLALTFWRTFHARFPHWLSHKASQAGIFILVLILFWQFVLTDISAPFHQVMHLLEAIALLTAIGLSMWGFQDDLVDARRRLRIVLATLSVAYCLLLLLFEFTDSPWRRQSWFMLSNAFVVFIALFASLLAIKDWLFTSVTQLGQPKISPSSALTDKLNAQLAAQIYLQPTLTIAQLAEAMTVPPHQLRKYINEQLGFNHFSQFLNHHRLDHVVMQFKQADQVNTPILTLALNAGFNSIGPFNRAFKARFNTTPSQYRKQLFLD